MISISVTKFDKVAINAIARLPAYLHPFFEFISYVGHPITTCSLGFLIVVYGFIQHKPAILFSGASIWLALIISTTLKHLVERSRPFTEYVAAMHIPSFSFPSGHTTGSTVAFGLLAYYAYYLLPQPLNYILLVLLVALVILVGVSRVYLGAHYPTDVVGGWILGGIVLGIVIFVVKPLA